MSKLVYFLPPVLSAAHIMEEPLKKAGFEVVFEKEKINEDCMRECQVLIPAREPVTREILDLAPNLKLICKKGVGIDRIDLEECTRRGICVANTPYSNYISVGEQTIMLLLGAAKKIYPITLATRCDEPDSKANSKYQPIEIYGKTLSIIGLGHIGSYVAKLALGLGMKVVAYTRHPERADADKAIQLTDSMEEALKVGDFISLHVSGNAVNRNLIGEKELGLMKPTAILINTTRGFVIDEEALCRALENGTIAGAALDVVTKEPIEGSNPLIRMKNVLLTPHGGGFTQEAHERGYMDCARLIIDFDKGIYPETAVNNVNV